jgi:hypothetical protein
MDERERMLVAEEAVDRESGLVADAQPALAEDVEGLRLGRKQDLTQTFVAGLEPRDLVNDDLRRQFYESILQFSKSILQFSKSILQINFEISGKKLNTI